MEINQASLLFSQTADKDKGKCFSRVYTLFSSWLNDYCERLSQRAEQGERGKDGGKGGNAGKPGTLHCVVYFD